jgi:hypothetical protein
MFISTLQQGVDDYTERLLDVYEFGFCSLPTLNISRKLAAGGHGWKTLRRHTLGTKARSPKVSLEKPVFRGWLLSEGCPKKLLTRASEAVHKLARPKSFNSITVQAASFGQPLLQPSLRLSSLKSERERGGGITGERERKGSIAGQHAGGQEHRWRKLSFTILDDGRLMAVLHEIEHLIKGPKSLGRVVHNDLHAGLVQSWPLCQADVIASLRTTGISLFVESEQGDCREIHLAMDQHTAMLIAPVLQDHLSNPAVAQSSQRAVEHECVSQNLHQSAPTSVAFSARHHVTTTCEDARLCNSGAPKDAQRGRLRMIDGFQDTLESPMQELLRKVNEIQEQMHEITSVKDDIRELKAAEVPFSILPCLLESKCDFTCEWLCLSRLIEDVPLVFLSTRLIFICDVQAVKKRTG